VLASQADFVWASNRWTWRALAIQVSVAGVLVR
jgi:hypothetical protein